MTEQGRSIFGGAVSAAVIDKSGHKNPTSRADNATTVTKENVTHEVACEHVRQVLTTFTWPACLSRANVRPVGQDHIDAFMIGLVKPYFMGLMCSPRTKLLPDMTMNAVRLITQTQPRAVLDHKPE